MPKTRPMQQQRKRRVRISKEAPFPVPIATVTGETASNSNWIYYTATLHSNGVTVHHSGDMEFLYRMGFFGKGSMSRGQPQWAECQRLAALPYPRPGSGGWQGMLQARVTSRRRYMTHLKWHLLRAGDSGALTRVEQDLQVTVVEGPRHPPAEDVSVGEPRRPPSEGASKEPDTSNTEQGERRSDDEMEVEERGEAPENGHHAAEVKRSTDDADWAEGDGDAEFWGTGVDLDGDGSVCQKPEKVSRDDALTSWDSCEGDAQFWGTQDDANVESRLSGHSSSKPVDCVAPQTCLSGRSPTRKTTGLSGSEGGSSLADRLRSQDQPSSLCVTNKDGVGDGNRELACDVKKDMAHDTKKDRARDTNKGLERDTNKDLACDTNKDLACDTNKDPACDTNTDPACDTNKDPACDTNKDLALDTNKDLTCDTTRDQVCDADRDLAHTCATGKSSADDDDDDVGPAIPDPGKANCVEVCEEDTPDKNALDSEGAPDKNTPVQHDDSPGKNTPKCGTDLNAQWSEFCQQTDGDSDSDIPLASGEGQRLFVVPDSDEEEATAEGQICRTQTRWKPVVKPDPFPVRERLHLSSEEAFFLSYGLGCLTVLDSYQTPLTLSQLWGTFCRRQPDFVPSYVAYHYYRSKNWVPKTGLKFGCTFLLYKDGPPFYHGSYSVVVQFVDEEGSAVEGHGEWRQFSWTSLAGLKRITEHVGKELLVCYVIKPMDMTPQDLLSPACIPRFRIKEMLVSRWLSSQEREKEALDDLP